MKNFVPPAKDNEWFTEEIIVKGKNIRTLVNGKVICDYTEPDGVTGRWKRSTRARSPSRPTIPRARPTTRTSRSSRFRNRVGSESRRRGREIAENWAACVSCGVSAYLRPAAERAVCLKTRISPSSMNIWNRFAPLESCSDDQKRCFRDCRIRLVASSPRRPARSRRKTPCWPSFMAAECISTSPATTTARRPI